MRVAILAHNACQADALGTQIAGKVRYFTSLGWECRVYIESADRLHPQVRNHCREITAVRLWRNREERDYLLNADLVFAEYGMYFPLLDLLPALANGKPHI